jgi:hypothetical protein
MLADGKSIAVTLDEEQELLSPQQWTAPRSVDKV